MDVAIMVKRGREGDACEIELDQRDFLNQRREKRPPTTERKGRKGRKGEGGERGALPVEEGAD